MAGYHKKFVDMVVKSATDFFTSTGVKSVKLVDGASAKSAVKAGELFSASLGFAGTQVKGAMIVTTHAAAIAATNPQREYMQTFTDADHSDWIGEMNNQIVGNLKRLLSSYKVTFSLGTPTVINGKDLSVANQERARFQPLEFMIDDFKVKILFSAEFTADVNFDVEGSSKSDQAAGGEAMLF